MISTHLHTRHQPAWTTAFSPDSSEIAFIRNPDKVEAISTNSDIFVMPLNGGAPKNITVRNRGYDAGPVYTRDGKYILYRSQATAGFEADRWRLMAYNRATGASVELTKGFDLQVEDVVLVAGRKHDLLHRRRSREESDL